MSKKSILDEIGRAEAFKLMGQAVAEAALRSRAAGLTEASHVDGRTVFITPRKQPDKSRSEQKKPA